MKKFIFPIMLTLMGCMVLTSCGNAKGEKLSTILSIVPSHDLLEACDIEVTYKGKGGVDMTDTITAATRWSKEIVNDSFPTEIGLVNLRYLIKPDFKPTKNIYNLWCICEMRTREQIFHEKTYYLDLFYVQGAKVKSYLDLTNLQVQAGAQNRSVISTFHGKEIEPFFSNSKDGDADPAIQGSCHYLVEKTSPADNDAASKYFKFTAK